MSKQKPKLKPEVKRINDLEANKAYDAIVASKEQILTAWIAATGLKPEETMLVVRNYAGGDTGVFCRKLTEEDSQVLCPKCGCNLTKP